MFQVHILDLNASNASKPFHIIGPQCLQCIRAIDGDDGGGGGGGFPRTLESGRSPGPTCPGTKYPVRGIPHFDILGAQGALDIHNFGRVKGSDVAICADLYGFFIKSLFDLLNWTFA